MSSLTERYSTHDGRSVGAALMQGFSVDSDAKGSSDSREGRIESTSGMLRYGCETSNPSSETHPDM